MRFCSFPQIDSVEDLDNKNQSKENNDIDYSQRRSGEIVCIVRKNSCNYSDLAKNYHDAASKLMNASNSMNHLCLPLKPYGKASSKHSSDSHKKGREENEVSNDRMRGLPT